MPKKPGRQLSARHLIAIQSAELGAKVLEAVRKGTQATAKAVYDALYIKGAVNDLANLSGKDLNTNTGISKELASVLRGSFEFSKLLVNLSYKFLTTYT